MNISHKNCYNDCFIYKIPLILGQQFISPEEMNHKKDTDCNHAIRVFFSFII